MSVHATFATESMFEVETRLSNSSAYIKTVTRKPIAAQPWHCAVIVVPDPGFTIDLVIGNRISQLVVTA